MANIVQNQNVNYGLYYNVLDYFKAIMKNHPSLNYVSQGDVFSIDNKEFPAYPLGNILITNTVLTEKTIIHSCQLTIADKVKLKANESQPTTNEQSIPYYGTDDVVDIFANTLSIVNDLTTYTQFSVEAFDIPANINVAPFKDKFDNGLAGHVATFDLVAFGFRNRCTYTLLTDGDLDFSC
jgi:hypothetical protein